jgi:hypothetical protein
LIVAYSLSIVIRAKPICKINFNYRTVKYLKSKTGNGVYEQYSVSLGQCSARYS